MMNLPYPWDLYASLQAKLARRQQVDDRSWGLEAGLDHLLAEPNRPPSEEKLDRTVRSENRRERYRAQLRRVHLALEDCEADLEGEVAARQALRAAQVQVADEDWALLYAVGEGRDYGELAAARGVSAGHLRVRVLRLRRGLAEWSSSLPMLRLSRRAA
jgi:hypothetical protein